MPRGKASRVKVSLQSRACGRCARSASCFCSSAAPEKGSEGPAEASRPGWVPAAALAAGGGAGGALRPSLLPTPSPEPRESPRLHSRGANSIQNRKNHLLCDFSRFAPQGRAGFPGTEMVLGDGSFLLSPRDKCEVGVTRGGAAEKGRSRGQSGLDV